MSDEKTGVPATEASRVEIWGLLLQGRTDEVAKWGDSIVPVLIECVKNSRMPQAPPGWPLVPLVLWERSYEKTVGDNAIDALVKIGPPAVPLLLKALGSARPVPEAVDVIVKMGPKAVPALVEALKDQSSDARYTAAKGLEKIARETKIDLRAVEKALREYVDSVRKKGNLVETREAEKEAAGYYVRIATAARKYAAQKYALAGDGVALEGTVKPPSDKKMYRAGARRALA